MPVTELVTFCTYLDCFEGTQKLSGKEELWSYLSIDITTHV